MTDKTTNDQERKRQADAIERRRAEFEAELVGLDGRVSSLDDLEHSVEVEATELTEKIKALAEEQKVLDQRKKQLEAEARKIGDRRTEIAAERKKLAREKHVVLESLRQLDSRRDEIERQQAYEEAQRAASFQVEAPAAAPAAEPSEPGQQPSAENKRTSPRLKVQVDVTLHTEHNFYAGLTDDISEGGLFIATHENLPVGTQMEMTLALPEHDPFQVTGEVRWLREYNEFTADVSPGVGVAFTDLGENHRLLIEEFIRQRSPLLYESF